MLKRKIIILVLVIVLLLCQSLSVNSQLHFITGNDYFKLSENEKGMYIAGLFDMFIMATHLWNKDY